MKEIIRCVCCAPAVVDLPAGFASEERLWCPERNEAVEHDDGCTFGTAGKPMRGTYADYRISLDGHAAVYG